MNLRQSKFISISIGSTVVKVALVKSSGFVEKLVSRNIDKNGPDAALRAALEGIPPKGAGVLCVIPGDVATAKTLEIPSVDHEEIESILALQASRHTPFNKDEILTSYIKIGNPKPNFTRVLLIIVRRDTVKDKLAVIKKAGLNISAVTFVPEGIARFYAAAFKVKKSDLPVAIIDVGMLSTNYIVESQSLIVMCRNIPIGIEHLSIDTEAPQQLVNEIKASMDTYEHEAIDRKPGRFILTTNHMALGGLDNKIREIVAGARVDIAPYTDYIQTSKPAKETLAKSFMDETALDVIAPAVAAARCQADLVPQDIKDQRAVAEKLKATYLAGVLITLVLISIGGAVMSKLYYKDTFLKRKLIDKYASQRQEVSNMENLIRRTKILNEFLQTRDLALDAVRELYVLTPQEIYLSSVNMDVTEGSFSIQGAADAMSQVFTYVTALESSPLFEGVKTKSTSTKKDRDKTVASFEIVMQLSKTDSAKKDKPAEPTAAASNKSAAAK